MKIKLSENERIDTLQYKDLQLVQDKTKYCFSTDAVLLANFVRAGKNKKVLDLCTGSGVVATLVLAKNNLKEIFGIELQKPLYDLALKSVALNGLEEKVHLIHSPIQEAHKYFEKHSFDVILANPPYEKVEGHFLSENAELNTCKYETHLNLDSLVKVASDLLKFGGKFYLIYKSSRVAELITSLKQHKLEPKVMQFIQPKKDLNSNVVLIEAVKEGKSGIIVKPTLIINDENGSYSAEFKKIYGENN